MTKTAPMKLVAASGINAGELVAWSHYGVHLTHFGLMTALEHAGLDAKAARVLANRNAFARACNRLSVARIIRQLDDNPTALTFQFTAEHRNDDQFQYDLEAKLVLFKKSGDLHCDNPTVLAAAKTEFDRCLGERTSNDVTRVLQRLFKKQTDIFAISRRGGCYLVPPGQAAFLDQIEKFVLETRGEMTRFQVNCSAAGPTRSMTEAVSNTLSRAISTLSEKIEKFDDETSDKIIERKAKEIEELRFKIETYSFYLSEQRDKVEEALAGASKKLKEKASSLAAA